MQNAVEASSRPGINLLNRETQINPFPEYTRLRKEYPICQLEPYGTWALSRYADVEMALRRTDLFSSAGIKELYEPFWLAKDCWRDYSILSQDPPQHAGTRSFFNKAFVTRSIKLMEPKIKEIASALAQKIEPGTNTEFISAFSDPFAGTVLRTIGLDVLTTADMREWLDLSERVNLGKPSGDHVAALEDVLRRHSKALRNLIDSRKASSDPSLIGQWLQITTDKTVLSFLELLVGAGFHTVSYSLTHCIMQLSKRPELMQVLKREPDRIPAFVEEQLRYDPPTHQLLRRTKQQVVIEDQVLPKSAFVVLLLGSANRDELRFPDPDEFKLDRMNTREHLAFGHGPHACIGSALARLELAIALRSLLQRFETVMCPPDCHLDWVPSTNAHGVRQLPAIFY